MTAARRAKTGAPTGTVYISSERKQGIARRRRREEQRWAARSGSVTVTYREILPNNREILPSLATESAIDTAQASDLGIATSVDNLQVEVEGSRLGRGEAGTKPSE